VNLKNASTFASPGTISARGPHLVELDIMPYPITVRSFSEPIAMARHRAILSAYGISASAVGACEDLQVRLSDRVECDTLPVMSTTLSKT